MPYGRMTTVSKPSWMKDAPTSTSDTSSTPSPTVSRPWSARKATESKSEETAEKPATKFGIKKEPEPPAATKKEVTAKLQSREIKVPLKVEKTIPTKQPTTILKKSELNPSSDTKTPPSKSPTPSSTAKTPVSSSAASDRSSKSPSTFASSKAPSSSAYSSSKSPSKTPDYDEEEDESSEEESSEESSEEEETDSDDDDDFDFDEIEEETRFKAPTPPPTNTQFNLPQLRRVSQPKVDQRTLEPVTAEPQFKKPELKKVVTRQKSESKIRERSKSPEPKFIKPKLRKVPSSLKAPAFKEKLPTVELKRPPPKPEPEPSKKQTEQFPAKPSVLRAESNKRIPLPPPPPPPPPPRGLAPPPEFEKKPITMKHRETLEKLKSRPRRRPDWSEMMKEVEEMRTNKKLRHVQCNDRSSPIITCKSLTKVNGQYLFETEKKPNELDQLLQEINRGVKLRPTKTNDRSKPILEGLRQFRRQMTIEEQIQKSESKAFVAEEPAKGALAPIISTICDDFDDIDKIRDDLQSTKQMLAHELRSKEFHERENKRLAARVAALEAELARERWNPMDNTSDEPYDHPTEESVVSNLKREVEETQKTAKVLQKKFEETTDQLDKAHKEIEEQKRVIVNLERRLQIYEDGSNFTDIDKEGGDFEPARRQSEAQQTKESSPEAELVLSEEEEVEELTEEQKAERAERRLKREVAMLQTKLKKLKDKELNAKSDRRALRENMKKNQQLLRSEKKKMKKLQKEVEKMAKMMQSVENEFNDDDENKDEDVEDEEPEESEESEAESEESESEESESDTESQSEAEDAEDQKKKDNLDPRVKQHEARLNSLKKGNYMLEANSDHLKDELKELKEKCSALQSDLDSVIDLC